jgi:choline-sulfatase
MSNLLIIMADELAREGLGCYGTSFAVTPNIDALAKRGLRFSNAYSPSPVCVPARAAFATGRYVANNKCSSNAEPYHGQLPSWGHMHRTLDRPCSSVGKLHFRSSDDDNGFDEELNALHIRNGVGFVHGLLRRQRKLFETAHFADEIGPGEDPYTDYDRRVCTDARAWLEARTGGADSEPWTLFVSLLRPHYPLTCPPQFYELYDPATLPERRFAGASTEFAHPVLGAFRSYYDYDDAFTDETRQVARASYYGLCSFVDHVVGNLLGTLENAGALDDTTIIFTSDHGELNGEHGLWTKMTMHEESVAVPLIISGPGIGADTVDAPVSLVDVYPTVAELIGFDDEGGPAHDGRSLLATARDPDHERCVFSEYHDSGAITGFFMARMGCWKYIHYPGFAPQLFDIEADPHETNDLGLDESYADVRANCLARMCAELGDPDVLNDDVFAAQAAVIEKLGGVDAVMRTPGFDFTPVE